MELLDAVQLELRIIKETQTQETDVIKKKHVQSLVKYKMMKYLCSSPIWPVITCKDNYVLIIVLETYVNHKYMSHDAS